MSRRQSLDRPGILSPPGPFLTPSPSPSISASPRLQPSPSLSPFPQDVLLVTSNSITNHTHEQERKAATPGRRQSIHQFANSSPNAGTVVFQPSPSQSPAAATSVIGVTAGGQHLTQTTAAGSITVTATSTTTGNEFNTTLVGSNNIQLNKKGGYKRATQQQQHSQAFSNAVASAHIANYNHQQQQQQQHHQLQQQHQQQQANSQQHHHPASQQAHTTTTVAGGYGQSTTSANNTPTSFATANVASSPKGQTKKVTASGTNTASSAATAATTTLTQGQQFQHYNQSSSPLIADSPIPSPSNVITAAAVKPPTPQPMQMLQQQFTITAGSLPQQTGQAGGQQGQQQVFQFIQGPNGQLIAAPHQQHHQQQQQFHRFIGGSIATSVTTPTYSISNSMTTTTNATTKSAQQSNKGPQQILPKPQHQLQQQQNASGETQQHNKQTKNNNQNGPTATQQQHHQQQIILPSGATASLTTTQQPLLINQMPVLVQQQTPQGVQLILRPPTPQLHTGAPSLVIQNARPQPQLQQQQPQQVLRILGTNGATMQLAAATPTFIVSSQANLIHQTANHLQSIKTSAQSPAITQLSGLHAALSAAAANNPRSQQFTTAINSHLLGPSMAAQIQNLQLAAAAANGSGITQIQMPNGLSATTSGGAILSQLPAQFQQSLNAGGGLINLNQLSSANIQQLQAAAAAAGVTFQTPPPPPQSSAASSASSNDLYQSSTPEPMRQSTPGLQTINASPQHVQQLPNGTTIINAASSAAATIQLQQQQQQQQQAQIQQLQQQLQQTENQVKQAQAQQAQQQAAAEPKKKPRARKKKQTAAATASNTTTTPPPAPSPTINTKATITAIPAQTPPLPANQNNQQQSSAQNKPNTTTLNYSINISAAAPNNEQQQQRPKSSSPAPSIQRASNGKLDLGNVMKLCGIMEDDDDEDDFQMEMSSTNSSTQHQSTVNDSASSSAATNTAQTSSSSNSTGNHQSNDIMISLPSQNGVETLPFTLSIPASAAHAAHSTNDTSGSSTADSNTPNIVIKIDQPDNANAPYTISIPRLPTAEEIAKQAQKHIAAAQHHPAQASITQVRSQQQTTPSNSMATITFTVPTAAASQPPQNVVASSTTSPATASSVSSTSTNSTAVTPATTSTTTTMATVKPRRKPAVRRNGKKQEAAAAAAAAAAVAAASASTISVTQSSHSNSQSNNQSNTSSNTTQFQQNSSQQSTTSTSAPASSTTVSNVTAALQNASGHVPSQIGNIQISQIDASKVNSHHNAMPNSVAAAVENKIQIMPILETSGTIKLGAPSNVASTLAAAQLQLQQQQQQQAAAQIVLQPNHNAQPHHDTPASIKLVAIPQSTTAQSNATTQSSNTGGGATPIQLTATSGIGSGSNNLPAATILPPHLTGIPGNVSISVGSSASAAALIPQLTGSLTLAISEQHERLILRHDPNQPQDQQSQLILQALLKGTLPNLTIINEPKVDNSNNKQQQNQLTAAQKTATQTQTSSTGAISKNSGKNSQQQQQQQQAATTTVTTSSQTSQQQQAEPPKRFEIRPINLPLQPPPPQLSAQNSQQQQSFQQHSSAGSGSQQGQRYVALPKIDPNTQQLFCLNTVNNQITPISATQTTASFGPTERLLIASAGINAQQLAQCLQQGQIQFNDSNSSLQQQQQQSSNNNSSQSVQQQRVQPPQQQIVHPQPQPVQPMLQASNITTTTTLATTTTTTTVTKQVANVAPIIDQSKAKLEPGGKVGKKKPVRKPKQTTTAAEVATMIKNASVVKPMPKLDLLTQKPNNNPVQIVQPNVASGKQIVAVTTTSSSSSVTTTTTITSSSTIQPFQTSGTKLVGITAPMQQRSTQQQQQQPTSSSLTMQQMPTSSTTSAMVNSTSTTSTFASMNTTSSFQQQQQFIPPSPAPSPQLQQQQQQQQAPPQQQHTVSRVQTIQLTPQQQQMFQQVQMQIQYLTNKLQQPKGQSAMPILPADFDASIFAPYTKPMSTADINMTLQRLFMERQRILAAGKEIPTPEALLPTPNGNGGFTLLPQQQQQLAMSIQQQQQQQQVQQQQQQNEANKLSQSSTIPANIVQPNNHSTTTQTAAASQQQQAQPQLVSQQQQTTNPANRIHIYPMQHQSSTNNQHQQQQQQQKPPQQQQKQQQQVNKLPTPQASPVLQQTKQAKETTSATIAKHKQVATAQLQQMQQQQQTPQLISTQSNQILLQQQQQPMQQGQQKQQSALPTLLALPNNLSGMQQMQQQIQQHQQLQRQQQYTLIGTAGMPNNGPPPLVFTNSIQAITVPASSSASTTLTTGGNAGISSTATMLQQPSQLVPLTPIGQPMQLQNQQQQHQQQQQQQQTQTMSPFISSTATTLTTTTPSSTTPVQTTVNAVSTTATTSTTTPLITTPTTAAVSTNDTLSFSNTITTNNNNNLLPSAQTQPQPQQQQQQQQQCLSLNAPSLIAPNINSMTPNCGARMKIEELPSPKPKIARLSLFIRQLEVDQQSCLQPDYKHPFNSKEEAVKRLVRYHCMYQNDEPILSDEEYEFEDTALQIQDKFRTISGKFQKLLLQEAMLPHRTSEHCQLQQLMIEDLRHEIDELRDVEQQDVKLESKNEAIDELKQEEDIKNVLLMNGSSDADYTSCYDKAAASAIDSIKDEIKSESLTLEQQKAHVMDTFDMLKNAPNSNAMYSKSQADEKQQTVATCDWQNVTDAESFISERLQQTVSSNNNCDNTKSKRDSDNDVKRECAGYDLESDLTPSFDMKKLAVKEMQTTCSDATNSDDLEQQQVPSFSQELSPQSKKSTAQQHDEEWRCLEKELNMLHQDHKKLQQQQHLQQQQQIHHQQPAFIENSANTNSLINHHSSAHDQNHMVDLFPNGCINRNIPGTTSITTNNSCSGQSQQPSLTHQPDQSQNQHHGAAHALSEFFSPESEVHKAVETRLEAMFGESPVHLSKHDSDSQDIESGLDEIFGDTKSPVEQSNKIKQQHQQRLWEQDAFLHTTPNNTGLTFDTDQQQQQQQQQQQFVIGAGMQQSHAQTNQQQQQHHIQLSCSNNPRWMQTMEAQFNEFMTNANTSNVSSNNGANLMNSTQVVANTNGGIVMNHEHQQQQESRKRHWNGDLSGLGSVSDMDDESNSKKLCTTSGGSSTSSSPMSHHNMTHQQQQQQQQQHELLDSDLLGLHDGIGVGVVEPHATNGPGGFSQMLQQHHNVFIPQQQQQLQQQSHFASILNGGMDASQQPQFQQFQQQMQHQQVQLQMQQQHHHQQHNQLQHQLNSQQLLQHNNNHVSAPPEFDDDISRHVQNAIESILNLQNSESDSLNFTLDNSMGSFLGDSILDDRQPMAAVQALPSCQADAVKQRQQTLVEELSDCLINAGNNASGSAVNAATGNLLDSSNNMLLDHQQQHLINNVNHVSQHQQHGQMQGMHNVPQMHHNSVGHVQGQQQQQQHGQVQINDFSCVTNGIDDTVKTIMSS